MRRKIFYLLVLISCVSMISAAKQKCNMDACCKMQTQEKTPRVIKASGAAHADFDMSPLRHFVFNI